ncbi:MAG: hypothetical protein JWN76_3445 [Chitinophagaceae bacterium]|nr:hypothetical protein [Chitinophagaceae bacterium]
MKSFILQTRLSIILAFLTLFTSISTFAQDKKVDVNITTGSNDAFWGSPWVWIIGVAVFILLLVALLRGGRRADV